MESENDISPSKRIMNRGSSMSSERVLSPLKSESGQSTASSRDNGEKQLNSNLEVSTKLERYLKEKVSKELFSRQGKTSVLFIWTVGTFIAAYGCTQVEVDFKIDFFIKPGAYVYNALTYNREYFASGFAPNFYVTNPELDFTSRDS